MRLFEARGRKDDFVYDSFQPAFDPESDGDPMVKQVAVHEVLCRFEQLSVRGLMSAKVRRRLLKALSR